MANGQNVGNRIGRFLGVFLEVVERASGIFHESDRPMSFVTETGFGLTQLSSWMIKDASD